MSRFCASVVQDSDKRFLRDRTDWGDRSVVGEPPMNRRARLVAFVAFVALVAGVSLAGCVSSGSVATERAAAATDAAASETDPASAMRIALDDLVGQMTPPSEDAERNIGVTPPEGETTVATYLQDEIIAAFLRARIPGLAVYERTHINTLLGEANLGISGLISE